MFSNDNVERKDVILEKLQNYTQNILVIVFGFLPLFFIPFKSVPFEYTKILFVLTGIIFALVLFSLSVLRSGKISFNMPYAIWGLWFVFLVSLISSMLSGDFRDSFIGDFFSIHSTAFIGVLALASSVWVLVGASKIAVMRMYILIAISTIVLALFHILRLIFGTDFLSMGIFNNAVSTPVGGWNDLALFLGLSILLSLVALEQLPLTKWGKYLFWLVSVMALIMLAVINFLYIWFVLGLVSLVMLVYTLRKPTLPASQQPLLNEEKKVETSSSLMLSIVVFVISILFIVGGSAVGGFVNNITNISYVEVYPSIGSTIDIAGNVYRENAFLGIGANKFVDAWRMYKNEAINSTIFWSTDFNAGSGYIPTFFITTGVFGAVAWIVFFIMFITLGIRMFIKSKGSDRMWYFIGTSSFVTASYIWILSIVYVPGATILIIGALCTGVTFLAYNALSPVDRKPIIFGADRRTGFVLTLGVIAVIVISVSTLYVVGRHFSSAYIFTNSVNMANNRVPIEEVETELVKAYDLSGSDLYVRRIAEYQFARIEALLSVASPTEEQRQQFDQAIANGINAGNLATEADSLEPANWAVLGNIYSLLVSVNIEGSYEKALDALNNARNLDPKNPARYLELANLEARKGNFAEAKSLTEEAIKLKPNYSDALFFLTQVAIATGDVEKAIQSARAIITLEPQNPARYYQLGVLESSQGNTENGVLAFEGAVRLDADYSNARYFLALGYDALGRTADAKVQLEKVLELNPGNQDVMSLLQKIETEGSLSITSSPSEQLISTDDISISEDTNDVVITDNPDTSLVKPINVAPSSSAKVEEFDNSGQKSDFVPVENEL